MRVMICEEDEEYVESLSQKIRTFACDEDVIIESFTDMVGAARRVQQQQIDIAFLGPVVHGRNGFELGEIMKEKYPQCAIMFVCDDFRYTHEMFKHKAFQMILKVQDDLVENEFKRACGLCRKDYFEISFLLENGKTKLFIPSEIEYIEEYDDQTLVVTEDERFYGKFKNIHEVKEYLSKYNYFQMHPHFFVNMRHIDLIKNTEVRLDNGNLIPISVMNRGAIDRALQIFIGRTE